jgi:NAD(P)H-hydrate epimerase
MPETITQLPQLPPRSADSHKGDYGRALLIGGSRGMSGAIALAGKATLRAGAGLVKLAVPDRVLETVAQFDPCYMAMALADDAHGQLSLAALDALNQHAAAADCVAIGPGLGRSDDLTQLVTQFYCTHEGPLLLDADALNALSSSKTVLAGAAGPRIITPHPGEFSRLLGGEKLTREEAIERAQHLAAEHGVVIVLKGNHTLVTDGQQSYFNRTGNPGMATGGMGDVLAGLIGSLWGQFKNAQQATAMGASLHLEAARVASDSKGFMGLLPNDVIDILPAILSRAENDALITAGIRQAEV